MKEEWNAIAPVSMTYDGIPFKRFNKSTSADGTTVRYFYRCASRMPGKKRCGCLISGSCPITFDPTGFLRYATGTKHTCEEHRDRACQYDRTVAESVLQPGRSASVSRMPRKRVGRCTGGEARNRDRSARGATIIPDPRSRMSIELTNPHWDPDYCSRLVELRRGLVALPDKCWTKLAGGEDSRHYLPNLSIDPKLSGLYSEVEAACKGAVAYARSRQPELKYLKYSVLRTQPGAPSQYFGTENRLHQDWDPATWLRPPELQPCSIIQAIDPFWFLWNDVLDEEGQPVGPPKQSHIERGQFVFFTNKLFHAGGGNATDGVVYRLFVYLAAEPGVEFPSYIYFESKTKARAEELPLPDFPCAVEPPYARGRKRIRSF